MEQVSQGSKSPKQLTIFYSQSESVRMVKPCAKLTLSFLHSQESSTGKGIIYRGTILKSDNSLKIIPNRQHLPSNPRFN